MPTRAGWLLAGRFLGAVELYVLAAGAWLLVAVAVARVRLAQLRLEVASEVHPVRIHAGAEARVEVRATNLGARRTPLLRLRDPVTGTRGARITLVPLSRQATARAAYRLPSSHRGVVRVGPLTVEVVDPLGLATTTAPAVAPLDVTVFPRIDTVAPPVEAGGRDPHAGRVRPGSLSHQGEDFYALRPYVVGDDLRRVHWASTARHDELMVRQDELPWQGRTTMVLDTRQTRWTPDDFERGVSAIASLVSACTNRRDLVRLLATDGSDSGSGAGHAHIEAVLEQLAVVDLSGRASLRRTLEHLDTHAGSGSLVMVLGRLDPGDMQVLVRLRRRFGAVWVVLFTDGRDVADSSTRTARGLEMVEVGPGEDFALQWADARRRGTNRLAGGVA